jgi:hypothetical protein
MKTPVSNLKDSTPKEAPQAMLRAGRVRAVSAQPGYRLSIKSASNSVCSFGSVVRTLISCGCMKRSGQVQSGMSPVNLVDFHHE